MQRLQDDLQLQLKENEANVNTVKLDQVEIVFVTSRLAFSKKFLQYHDSLQFRGCINAKAIAFAMRDVLVDGPEPYSHSKLHLLSHDARLLLLLMQEFRKCKALALEISCTKSRSQIPATAESMTSLLQ